MPPKKSAARLAAASAAPARWPLVLVELVGFALAGYLFLISEHILFGGHVPCPRSKWFACHEIVRGAFSHLGPFGLALLGMLYFNFSLTLTAAALEPGRDARAWKWLKAAMVFSGVLFVAWLRSIELVYLKKICPWCWGVAAATLLQAFALLPHVLPNWRWPLRAGAVTGAFIAAIGFGFIGEKAFAIAPKIMTSGMDQHTSEAAESDTVPDEAAAAPAATPTPGETAPPSAAPPSRATPTPRPRATSKPARTPAAAPLNPADAAGLPQPTGNATATPAPDAAPPSANPSASATPGAAAPSATPPAPTRTPGRTTRAAAPKPAAVEFGEEPEVPDDEKTAILRQRGFKFAASGEVIERAIPKAAPLLVMVYDPYCPECEALIKGGLNSEDVAALPISRVAIPEANLSGQISGLVKAMPTLLLFDNAGNVLFKHEGRMAGRTLAAKLTAAIEKAAEAAAGAPTP